VNFFGPHSEYVVSGSDDGYVYIWRKDTGKIVNWLKGVFSGPCSSNDACFINARVFAGDRDIVNVVQGHPFECALAVSGIENDVRIFRPTGSESNSLANLEQQMAANRERVSDRKIVHVHVR
jgi:WD40 repeat protein